MSIEIEKEEGEIDFVVSNEASPTIKIEQPVTPTIDCPHHGESILFSMQGYSDNSDLEWDVEIGCAHCYAEVMRELTQARMQNE